jgi:putative membrane protein
MASEARARGEERRLHPLSWLFVLLTQLRHGLLPLLVLLLFGRGEWWELGVVFAAVALAMYSLVFSLGFRYRLDADELIVREGLIDRTERHIPYARIQNIVQRRNPLHRLFGVTELRLESAGGSRPEAVMNVITLADAVRIEHVLRAHAPGAADAAGGAADDGERRLLALGARELLLLGLTTQRGWAVVGAAMAVLWQLLPEEDNLMRVVWRAVESAVGEGATLVPGPFATAIAATVLLVLFAVAVKLLSVAAAFVSFHRFRLGLRGVRVRTEAGLLTRAVASARLDKIQRLLFAESWLARRLGRRSLACEVAGGAVAANEDEGTRLHWLAPIATPATVARLADELAPGLDVDRLPWQPLHPRAWRRMFNASALVWTLVALLAGLNLGPVVVPAWLVLIGWAAIAARGEARFAGYVWHDGVVGYRNGWFNRRWTLARVAKGQSVRWKQSPLDRRAGMATVAIDTAGVRPQALRLEIPYLDAAHARELALQVGRALDALPAGEHHAPGENAAPAPVPTVGT